MWRNGLLVAMATSAMGLALVSCTMSEEARIPPPPAGAERVADWGVLDQARADQLRNGLAELARRWPAGQTLETQMWQLPSGTAWPALQAHYGRQPGWRVDPARQLSAGPLTPDAQAYVDEAGGAWLAVACFGGGTPAPVLVVQRARSGR